MTADKIRNRIDEGVTLFGFEYNGKAGNVDPYYIPEKRGTNIYFFLTVMSKLYMILNQ